VAEKATATCATIETVPTRKTATSKRMKLVVSDWNSDMVAAIANPKEIIVLFEIRSASGTRVAKPKAYPTWAKVTKVPIVFGSCEKEREIT
jgi:hypothetical protein